MADTSTTFSEPISANKTGVFVVGDGASYYVTENYSTSNNMDDVITDSNYVTVGDTPYLGVISPTDGAEGHPEKTYIGTVADSGKVALIAIEITQSANDLDGDYFILEDTAGTVAFWFDTGNTGTAEPVHGADRSIELIPTAGTSGDSLSEYIAGVINNDDEFLSWSEPGGVNYNTNVLNTYPFVVTADTVGSSGFGWTKEGTGAPPTLLGSYFTVYSMDDTAVVYFRGMVSQGATTDTIAVAEPSAGQSLSIPAYINYEWGIIQDSADVMSAVKDAIEDDGTFSYEYTNDDYDSLLVISPDLGNVTDANVGTSGFTLPVYSQGDSTSYYATPICPIGSYGYSADYATYYIRVSHLTWKKITLNSIP